MGKKGSERAPSGSIGNIATDLFTYLVPLRLYATISEYVRYHVQIRQLHHLKDQDRLYKWQRLPSFYFASPNCLSK